MNQLYPVAPLLLALKSPRDSDRIAAALALNRRSTERLTQPDRRRTIRGLLDALRDRNPKVRRLAEVGLQDGDLCKADGLTLIRLARTAPPPTRAAACRLMTRWFGRPALAALQDSLRARDPRVRRAAREALAELKGAWSPSSELPPHQAPIEAIDISPDGRLLASGSQDGALVLWDLRTGRAKWTQRRPDLEYYGVRSITFNSTGSRLAVVDNRCLTLFDPVTGKPMIECPPWESELICCNRFMEKGTCSNDYPLKFIDDQGRCFRTLKLPPEVYSIAISTDLSTLVLRMKDGLSVIDGETAELRCRLLRCDKFDSFEVLAISPDGKLLATADAYGTALRLWDTHTGKLLSAWSLQVPGGHRALEFSPDQRLLAFGSAVWDLSTSRWLWQGKSSAWMRSVRFTPDSRRLATAGDDQILTIWNAQTGRKLRTLGRLRNEIASIAVAPGGVTFAASYEDGTIQLCAAPHGNILRTFKGIPKTHALSFSPDGRQLACAAGSQARVFNLERTRGFRSIVPWEGRVSGVAWSPKDNTLALAGDAGKAAFLALHLPDKGFLAHHGDAQRAAILAYHNSKEGRLALAEDTDRVAMVALRQPGKGLLTPLRLPLFQAYTNAGKPIFSPDGRLLAGILDWKPMLWNLDANSKEGRQLQTFSSIYTLAFSPDGRLLAGGTDGYEVVLWNIENRNCSIVDILRTRGESPSALAFSPDGRRLAFTMSYDEAVEVREIPSGARVAVLRGHRDNGRCLAFLGNRRLVTGAADGSLRFWTIP